MKALVHFLQKKIQDISLKADKILQTRHEKDSPYEIQFEPIIKREF